MAAMDTAGRAEARSLKILPGLPHRDLVKHLGHPLLFSEVPRQGVGYEVEQSGLEGSPFRMSAL